MKGRSPLRKAVLAIVAASFLSFALASAGHWHAPTASTAVKMGCELCALGRSSVEVSGVTPLLLVQLLFVSFVLFSSWSAPASDLRSLPSPRAPPLR